MFISSVYGIKGGQLQVLVEVGPQNYQLYEHVMLPLNESGKVIMCGDMKLYPSCTFVCFVQYQTVFSIHVISELK